MVAALSLVYRCYLRRSLIPPNSLCLRLREGIEGTDRLTTFGAFEGSWLLATVGVIHDGEEGLPVDAFGVQSGDGRAEFTNLASRQFATIGPLFAAVHKWCLARGITTGYAQVSPRDVRLYKRLGFRSVGEVVDAAGDSVQVMVTTDAEADLGRLRRRIKAA